MKIVDVMIEVRQKILDIRNEDGITQYSQGQINAYLDCLAMLKDVTKIPVVLGGWYWVVSKDEFRQWHVTHMRLVKISKAYCYFTDKDCKIEKLNFKSRRDIPVKIGCKSAYNFVFATEEDAQKSLVARLPDILTK